MIKYIKDSIRELKHVVWPTRKETNNYFLPVVLVLIAFGLYLFIASTIFTKWLFGLKEIIDGNKTESSIESKVPETKNVSDKTKTPKVETAEITVKNKDGKKVEVKTEDTK